MSNTSRAWLYSLPEDERKAANLDLRRMICRQPCKKCDRLTVIKHYECFAPRVVCIDCQHADSAKANPK